MYIYIYIYHLSLSLSLYIYIYIYIYTHTYVPPPRGAQHGRREGAELGAADAPALLVVLSCQNDENTSVRFRRSEPSERRKRSSRQRFSLVRIPSAANAVASEESRVRLGRFLGAIHAPGPWVAPFFGTCSFSWLGAGGSARSGQYSQTTSQQFLNVISAKFELEHSIECVFLFCVIVINMKVLSTSHGSVVPFFELSKALFSNPLPTSES